MTFFTKTTATAATLVAATLMSLMVATSASAAFDICKKVRLQINNNSSGTIRLFDIDYYDYGSRKWRSEPTSNRIMQPRTSFRDTRNLEKVNRATTKIRAKYRILKSNGKWNMRKYYYYDSGAKTCTRGTRFVVNIR